MTCPICNTELEVRWIQDKDGDWYFYCNWCEGTIDKYERPV